ncbi:hypothetical protein BDD12DRAFT_810367 [Trichophaea hybrida]|nr:hypothetical protein BDD12DRAFT_810367 [Trichophaea hybrida]
MGFCELLQKYRSTVRDDDENGIFRAVFWTVLCGILLIPHGFGVFRWPQGDYVVGVLDDNISCGSSGSSFFFMVVLVPLNIFSSILVYASNFVRHFLQDLNNVDVKVPQEPSKKDVKEMEVSKQQDMEKMEVPKQQEVEEMKVSKEQVAKVSEVSGKLQQFVLSEHLRIRRLPSACLRLLFAEGYDQETAKMLVFGNITTPRQRGYML